MSSRRRGAHRRHGPHRYRPLLAGLIALAVIGGGFALFERLRPAQASTKVDGHAVLVGPTVSVSPGGAVDPSERSDPAAPPSSTPSSPAPAVVALDVPFPHRGPQTFHYASTAGPILGTAGRIRHFRLAMESNIDVVSMADFSAKVNDTLGDPRSWVAGGKYRLQQVPASSSYEFTIYLVTSTTTRHMCAPLQTNGFTSCREGSHVVLNLDRYMTSVDGYRTAKIPLETYRTYMINHEVGHALGHVHERCPSKGAPAPVMQQQTLGLHGCVPNPWPYIGGKPYDGPLGSY